MVSAPTERLSKFSVSSQTLWLARISHSHSPQFTNFTSFILETCGGTFSGTFSIIFAALITEARYLAGAPSASASPEFWGSANPGAPPRTRATALSWCPPFVGTLSSATTFGDAVEACKVSGEGTAKLTAKLGRATYVTDTGILPPDPGAMSLVFLIQGKMEGLTQEAEGV